MESAVLSGNQAASEALAYLSDSPLNEFLSKERIGT
jgi:hypothetical protein